MIEICYRLKGQRIDGDIIIDVFEPFEVESNARTFISIFGPWKNWKLYRLTTDYDERPWPACTIDVLETFDNIIT